MRRAAGAQRAFDPCCLHLETVPQTDAHPASQSLRTQGVTREKEGCSATDLKTNVPLHPESPTPQEEGEGGTFSRCCRGRSPGREHGSQRLREHGDLQELGEVRKQLLPTASRGKPACPPTRPAGKPLTVPSSLQKRAVSGAAWGRLGGQRPGGSRSFGLLSHGGVTVSYIPLLKITRRQDFWMFSQPEKKKLNATKDKYLP